MEAGDFEQVLSTVEPVRVVSDRSGPIYFGKITALPSTTLKIFSDRPCLSMKAYGSTDSILDRRAAAASS